MEKYLNEVPAEDVSSEVEFSTLMHLGYRPALDLECATRKHSYARLDVVHAAAPHQRCGQARRVGYLGKDANALALYRLKIRCSTHSLHAPGQMTLPGWFVLQDGGFSVAPSPRKTMQED